MVNHPEIFLSKGNPTVTFALYDAKHCSWLGIHFMRFLLGLLVYLLYLFVCFWLTLWGHVVGAKPSSEPMMGYCKLDPWELQWNLHRNLNILIKENAFEIFVRGMSAILSRPSMCLPFWGQNPNILGKLVKYNALTVCIAINNHGIIYAE